MMAGSQPHLESVRAMLVETLGDRLAPGVVDYSDLFADDGVLELPFGEAVKLEGRATIRAYTDELLGKIMLGPRTVTGYHDAGDAVILEYHGPVGNIDLGLTFEQDYVCVLRFAHGRIVLFREYLDPTRMPAKEAA